MNITRVEFFGPGERGDFICYCTVVYSDGKTSLVVRGLKLVRRNDKPILIAMPSHRGITGRWEDIVYPANPSSRKMLEEAVLKAWKEKEAASDGNKPGSR